MDFSDKGASEVVRPESDAAAARFSRYGPPGLDLIMRWFYEPSYDFGKRRAYPDEDIGRANGSGWPSFRSAEAEDARPSLWRPGAAGAVSAKLGAGEAEATTNGRPVTAGLLCRRCDVAQAKQGHAKGRRWR